MALMKGVCSYLPLSREYQSSLTTDQVEFSVQRDAHCLKCTRTCTVQRTNLTSWTSANGKRKGGKACLILILVHSITY